ncbi:MAG: hypothetical protein EXX96DRAFT_573317 [Benjaminiella poitrasii]|nr:MAG: hypothetical protein EXX96DRAFT_573317 [Benjaminiella poitrasii]
MERLPTEVFLQIITHLSLDDKLNCILVCSKWHNLITMANLYRSLDFCKQDKLHQAITFFHTQEDRRRQAVQDLTISDCCNSVHRRASLPTTFPNLKTLKFIATEEPKSIPVDQDSQLKQNVQMWQRLECVTERLRYYSITLCLLRSPQPVTHLRSIHIIYHSDQFYEESRHAENYYKFRSLLRYLKNAPHLSDLSVANTFVSLKDLECIHQSCPRLESLALNQVNMRFANRHIHLILGSFEKVNLNGLPVWKAADSLRRLTISTANSADDDDVGKDQMIQLHWLEYLGQKYPHLTHLSMLPLSVDPRPSNLLEEQLMTNFGTTWTQLKSFHSALYPLTAQLIQAMDTNQVQLNQLVLHGDPDLIEKQLISLKSSKQKETITQLTLQYSKGHPAADTNGWYLKENCGWIESGLLSELSRLRQLTITTIDIEQPIICYLDTLSAILKHVPVHLQVLELDGVCARNTQYLLDDRTIQLKQLRIGEFVVMQDDNNALSTLNGWLVHLLDHCPSLTSFDFDNRFDIDKSLFSTHHKYIVVQGWKRATTAE